MEKVYMITNEESEEMAICPTIEDVKKVMINDIIKEFINPKKMVENVKEWDGLLVDNYIHIEYFSIKEITYNTFIK